MPKMKQVRVIGGVFSFMVCSIGNLTKEKELDIGVGEYSFSSSICLPSRSICKAVYQKKKGPFVKHDVI